MVLKERGRVEIHTGGDMTWQIRMAEDENGDMVILDGTGESVDDIYAVGVLFHAAGAVNLPPAVKQALNEAHDILRACIAIVQATNDEKGNTSVEELPF